MPYSCIIVEDQPQVAQYLAQYLLQTGRYMVMGMADNRANAEALLSAMQPDLLLLDVYLPDGNGLALMKEAQATLSKTDVILLTAAKEVNILEQAIKQGVTDFLVKPVAQGRLEQALKNFEHRQQQLGAARELTQTMADQFFHQPGETIRIRLPKGIDPLTLDKIRQLFTEDPTRSYTALHVGQQVGVSRSTARRYLEHMLDAQVVTAEQVYGNVGRPERRYQLKT